MLLQRNPGSVVNLEVTDGNKFQYMFIAFAASIQGFSIVDQLSVLMQLTLRVSTEEFCLQLCAMLLINRFSPWLLELEILKMTQLGHGS